MENFPKNKSADDQKSEKDQKAIFRLGMSPVEGNKKIGPIRTHLFNYSTAKSMLADGVDTKIILRIDDTKKQSESKEMASKLLHFFRDELGFQLDITPENSEDEFGQSVFQSERQHIYDAYLMQLFDEGVAFVEKDSGLTLFDVEAFMRLHGDELMIDDMQEGLIRKKLEDLLNRGQKFFPLCRSDGSALYHMASVVDDGTFGVTHVVRGQDKMSNAEFQEMIRIALAFPEKRYLHVPMLQNRTDYSQKFNELVAGGIMPQALISYMISSGYGDPDALYLSLNNFVQTFDYEKLHKNSGQFDYQKLLSINRKISREIPADYYMESVLLILEKKGAENIISLLKQYKELRDYFIRKRSTPEEVYNLLNCILLPNHTPVNQEIITLSGQIIAMYDSGAELSISAIKQLHSNQKLVYDTLRWMCTGKTAFPDIDIFFEFLLRSGLFSACVFLIKTVINTEDNN